MVVELMDIPSFSYLIVVPFLESIDALSLRIVSSRLKAIIDDDAELIWTHFVQQDFGLVDTTKTLAVAPRSPEAPSIFGTTAEHSTIVVKSPFECWKQWKRVTLRFFGESNRNLNASFFLRAAKFWQTIESWCKNHGEFGSGVLETLVPGKAHHDWPVYFQNTPSFDAAQALYSFYSGQKRGYPQFALLGGWSAYSFLRVTVLSQPSLAPIPGTHMTIATCFPSDGIVYYVNQLTGNVENSVRNPCPPSGVDNMLVWLEEFAHRLQEGEYKLGVLVEKSQSITHYPQLPPRATRAVTRGVEVVASSVWIPKDSLFVYSIRIRLLRSNEDGYEPNRGFETCQLMSRHWRLINRGRPENVDGEGLIGMYPLLREGGYRNDSGDSAAHVVAGINEESVFSYQSMVEDNCSGTMSGFFTFVPGSIVEPTGMPFDVQVASFPLDRNPEFIYTY